MRCTITVRLFPGTRGAIPRRAPRTIGPVDAYRLAERVTSADDPRLHDYVGLTDVALRRKREPEEGLFMAEGEKVILRAVAAGYRIRSALLEERWLPGVAPALEAADAPA